MLFRCRHQLNRPTPPKKIPKKTENSAGPRADPCLTSSTSAAVSRILPQNAGTPERLSHTAPTSAAYRRSAHPWGLPAASGTAGRGGTTQKASLFHQTKRLSLVGVTRRRGARRGRAPWSRRRAGRVFFPSCQPGSAQEARACPARGAGEGVGGHPRKPRGRKLRAGRRSCGCPAPRGGGAWGPLFPRIATEGGRRGSAPSARCPHAGNEGTPATPPPTPAPSTSGTRRHAPRAFPLPPRNPRGASETKKAHPPNPRKSRKLNQNRAREQPNAAWGRGGGGRGRHSPRS